MKFTFGMTLLVWTISLCAQSDSIRYFNFDWKETTPDSAQFFRLVEETKGGVQVRDYYISGQLQMTGNYSLLSPEIQNGYFIWYFENGHKSAEGNYLHGIRDGVWTFWYPDGLKKEEIRFLKNRDNDYVSIWQSKRLNNSQKFIDKALRKKNRNKFDEAEELLNSALEICPYSAEACYQRGMLNVVRGRISEGCCDLLRAREFGYYDALHLNQQIRINCGRE